MSTPGDLTPSQLAKARAQLAAARQKVNQLTAQLNGAIASSQQAHGQLAALNAQLPGADLAIQQAQIRVQLANSLKAVVAQILLPRKDGQGRLAVREFMVVTPAVAAMIREGKTHMLYNAIDTGAQYGMFSMDKELAEVIKRGLVDTDLALTKAHNPDQVRMMAGLPVAAAAAR